jgi:hypothetical protein
MAAAHAGPRLPWLLPHLPPPKGNSLASSSDCMYLRDGLCEDLLSLWGAPEPTAKLTDHAHALRTISKW